MTWKEFMENEVFNIAMDLTNWDYDLSQAIVENFDYPVDENF